MITGEGWLSLKVRQLKRFVHAACGGDKSVEPWLSSPIHAAAGGVNVKAKLPTTASPTGAAGWRSA